MIWALLILALILVLVIGWVVSFLWEYLSTPAQQ